MVTWMGDYDTTETVNIPFNTFDSNDPSASVTITNLAAADLEIHKDGSVTQRASDAGVTVTINFDGVTGNHMAHINLSDNTDAGFYAAGSRYSVRMEGTTVDGATVNAWIGAWSIGIINEQVTAALVAHNLDHLCLTATAAADMTTEVADNTILSRVLANGDTSVFVPSTDGLQLIRDKLTDIEADTDVIDDATSGLVKIASDVATIPTTAMRGTDGANTTVPDAAGVAATPAEVASALTDIHLDHLLAADYDPASKPGVATALLNELIESDSGVSRLTINALEQGRGTNSVDTTSAADLVDLVWDELLTGAFHNVATSAGRRLRAIQDYSDYEDGAVWIDTVNGTAGTTDFENGTVGNPSNSIANALTIAASVGLTRLRILPGSTITFAADMSGYEIWGEGWTLALGGQACANTHIRGAEVTGVATAGAGAIYFHGCRMETSTLGKAYFIECGFDGTITALTAATYIFDRCYNNAEGGTPPTFDFGGAVGNTHVGFRAWQGSVEIANLGTAGTDVCSLTGAGQVVIASTCAGGTIKIVGAFTYEDNVVGGFSGTLMQDARTALIEYDPPTDAEMDAGHGLLATEAKQNTIKAKTDNLPESLKRNTAVAHWPIYMRLAADHVSPAPGLTVTGQRTLDGGALAGMVGAIVEIGSGWYDVQFAAADLDGVVAAFLFDGGVTADKYPLTVKTEP